MKNVSKIMVAVIVAGLAQAPLLAENSCKQEFYLRAEAGPSFGMCAYINANPIFWDPATEGYNGNLGTAAMVGLEGGANFYDWLSAGVRANYRSKFSYCKKQTPAGGGTPGFLGDKTRFFDVDNSSFMVTFLANRTAESCFAWDVCGAQIAPYAGVGLGFSRTTVYNFHSRKSATITVGNFVTQGVASLMTPYAQNKFAWDAQLGINIAFSNNTSLSVAYRYFDAGKFRSNNYIVDVLPDFTSAIEVPAWCGKLRAQELVVQVGIAW